MSKQCYLILQRLYRRLVVGPSPIDKPKGYSIYLKCRSTRLPFHFALDIQISIINRAQFIKGPLKEKLNLPYRKRVRRYGTMIYFIHLGT